MANYTRRQFTRLGDFGVSEEWYNADGCLLAYADHYNGDISSATLYDPSTDRVRAYNMRPKDRVLGIITRHLDRNGYKKCSRFVTLTGEVEADKL